MGQSFIITLREGLEMALIIVIILAYLKRSDHGYLISRVWLGVGVGVGVSILGGGLLFALGKGIEGKAEAVFEGLAMLLAMLVLTWMIFWMKGHARQIRGELESRVQRAISQGSGWTLAVVSLLAVGREGLETSLFLFSASRSSTPFQTTIGGALGLVAAIAMGVLLYRGTHRINLRVFFNTTGILLIIFAAGLLAQGTHELQEAELLPVTIEHVWDINGILDEGGTIGSFLKGLFGYNGNPSLLEVIAYPTYLVSLLYLFTRGAQAKPMRQAVNQPQNPPAEQNHPR